MIAISLRPSGRKWGTISFASTLHLRPILDLLLAEVPSKWQDDLRLGLQEALVNAAKHGNNLDPSKTVLVEFFVLDDQYWWVIADQGTGFSPGCSCSCNVEEAEEDINQVGECGRGLYILHQIFDQVHWNKKGTELRLCKQFKGRFRSASS
ncbi:ATP-binding protein [Thermocoleostomius sinensis]|uniref:Anti-sigma regulatory factor n=1 Tax=Thermocoleostomius sinensis A174 TaxID=2016057 RepID=A0A9E8ZI88_9CYAN|nr:anti-sigma regulatory factor [Thermocoleostomius sinensis]WAL61695.1 anti-sigma regulatory factor [Thermocoleostomius sinensis A174]